MVHIFSAMEPCASYPPWHDNSTHQTYLKPRSGKCLHYDFYVIDEVFGLGYLRVPTWAPFRLQAYFNGHNWLARRLEKAAIDFERADKAQTLADSLDAKPLHRWGKTFCPILRHVRAGYHGSFRQAEYATDVLFHRQADFQPR